MHGFFDSCLDVEVGEARLLRMHGARLKGAWLGDNFAFECRFNSHHGCCQSVKKLAAVRLNRHVCRLGHWWKSSCGERILNMFPSCELILYRLNSHSGAYGRTVG